VTIQLAGQDLIAIEEQAPEAGRRSAGATLVPPETRTGQGPGTQAPAGEEPGDIGRVLRAGHRLPGLGDDIGEDGYLAPGGGRDNWAPRGPDLPAYRAAVADVAAQVAAAAEGGHVHTAERILTARLGEPELAAVLAGTPYGVSGALGRLLGEIASFRPGLPPSAADLASLIRISLLAQIDALWWGRARVFLTDAELAEHGDLVDLEPLRRAGLLKFQYRRQAGALARRAVRAAERRAMPGRTPSGAGIRFPRTRPEMLDLLNRLAAQFAAIAPPGTPPLWVTSLARSAEHQHRLRVLGYLASLPSSHCAGYGADVEFAWFRRFGAHRRLRGLLLDWQRSGEISVIDEGQTWHVCMSPGCLDLAARTAVMSPDG